jgi:pyruvate/2-oxoglutarate/acetoin dehydrogenase E1 component
MLPQTEHAPALRRIQRRLQRLQNPNRKDIMKGVQQVLILLRDEAIPAKQALIAWKEEQQALNEERYSSYLYSQSDKSALNVPKVKPIYSAESPMVSGFEVLNAAFDAMLARDPRVIAFGEDVGYLGGVNQSFAGLQEKYGKLRVTDTVYWRTRGGQKAPVIVRTRGHRLEGIWHSGSLMAGIINLVRGMRVLVPRDMTRAAGFYNTLLQSDEPGMIIEVLNGYRLKEKLPDNIDEITVPVGVPEILRPGRDVTLVTYGAMCRIAMEAAERLAEVDVDVEVVDVQSLLPFDIHSMIVESLKKTSRIVFTDEDVPGGTTAYMMQKVLEEQKGYYWLDSEPRTLSSKAHRPAYGTDGDYFSKPNVESVFETVYDLMHEADPANYPLFYR